MEMIDMIRYADKKDIEILKYYDKHISESELKNSIKIKRVLMIFENNIFIGWLRYNLFWDNTPFMNMLYILEDYRNKGYGQQLMNYWEEEMLKMNYKRVLTSTLSNEGAQFFYRKNGYIDCGSLLLPKETLEIIFMKNLL
jgi:Acetyltransferases